MRDPQQIAAEFDLEHLPDDFYADPFPYYAALRCHAPVKRMPNGSYLLTRFADCEAVYKDPKTFSSDKKVEFKPKYGDSPLYEHHTTSLVFNDAPLHTRVRKLILGALTPRALKSMEPGLVLLVEQLLDAMEEKHARTGTVDIIEDFASAIPVEIIGNLLAVPAQDRGPLRGWSLAILGALEPRITPEQLDAGNRAEREFLDYLEILVAERKKKPGDPETDVLTRLIQGEVDGEKLRHHELLQNCIFILNAGHETTTNLIGNSIVTLALHPGERAKLIANPEVLRTGLEEVLRFESSNQLGNRIVAVPTEIAGVAMPAGTLITTCIGAANRDPEVFPEPDRFDIARSPNRHLAFAGGPHQCAGMNVARMEGRIAVAGFLARFPDYALAGAPERSRRARFRGFNRIPVRLK
ncbi:MAG: cytochrome P450 [Parvibaculaceae bacterium]